MYNVSIEADICVKGLFLDLDNNIILNKNFFCSIKNMYATNILINKHSKQTLCLL